MITGDDEINRPESVARQIGLPPGKAVTGMELQKMTDEELAADRKHLCFRPYRAAAQDENREGAHKGQRRNCGDDRRRRKRRPGA